MYSPYLPFVDQVPHMTVNDASYPPQQSPRNACQYYAFAIALEEMHRRAGQPISINRALGYWLAKNSGSEGNNGNNGATMGAVARSLQLYGVPTGNLWDDFNDFDADPPPEAIAQASQYPGVTISGVPYITRGPAKDNTIETFRMMFDAGLSVLARFRLNDSFDWEAGNYTDWRTTNWDGSYATGGGSRGDHVVTFFGIDMASQRILAANHWGGHWGDGGFFGVPFDKVLPGTQRCFDTFDYISNCAVAPVREVNSMTNPIPTSLTTGQQAKWNAWAHDQVMAAFNTVAGGNWQAAVYRAIEIGMSDKQFEMLAGDGLPRGTVRFYTDQLPPIVDTTGMRFETEA